MRRLLTFLLLLLAVCCTEPGTQESFLPCEEAVNGIYRFNFTFEELDLVYDFAFYTRVDGKWENSIPLYVRWLSPSGRSFSETVYFKVGENMEMYRSSVSFPEPGEWRVSVSVPESPGGFRGLGMICKRHGTR